MGDCNDSNNNINPGESEICGNADDENCDGVTTAGTWYEDADGDGDGYGNSAITKSQCTQPLGYVVNNTDCNDVNAAVKPGAKEICDSIDNDCDGQTDEGNIGSAWYSRC